MGVFYSAGAFRDTADPNVVPTRVLLKRVDAAVLQLRDLLLLPLQGLSQAADLASEGRRDGEIYVKKNDDSINKLSTSRQLDVFG